VSVLILKEYKKMGKKRDVRRNLVLKC